MHVRILISEQLSLICAVKCDKLELIELLCIIRYGLFASVSTILKSSMGKYLKDIVKYMIESLQSAEGIVVS